MSLYFLFCDLVDFLPLQWFQIPFGINSLFLMFKSGKAMDFLCEIRRASDITQMQIRESVFCHYCIWTLLFFFCFLFLCTNMLYLHHVMPL